MIYLILYINMVPYTFGPMWYSGIQVYIYLKNYTRSTSAGDGVYVGKCRLVNLQVCRGRNLNTQRCPALYIYIYTIYIWYHTVRTQTGLISCGSTNEIEKKLSPSLILLDSTLECTPTK